MSRSRWVASLLLVGALAGCGDDSDADPAQRPRAPRLGAQSPTASPTPAAPMNRLERPVADRLAAQLADDGLDLEYVDCPHWAGALPAALECKGYVDGVVGEVAVELSKDHDGRIEFDAWLDRGVVATTRLVERLVDEGYTAVDCGPVPAYPARLGMRIVCRVRAGGDTSHVVATVTDRGGGVEIEDY